jgi:hypothetical protein
LPQGTGGECGLRGGYVEMNNLHPKTVEELYKICSINLSPNGVGQVGMHANGMAGWIVWNSDTSNNMPAGVLYGRKRVVHCTTLVL